MAQRGSSPGASVCGSVVSGSTLGANTAMAGFRCEEAHTHTHTTHTHTTLTHTRTDMVELQCMVLMSVCVCVWGSALSLTDTDLPQLRQPLFLNTEGAQPARDLRHRLHDEARM